MDSQSDSKVVLKEFASGVKVVQSSKYSISILQWMPWQKYSSKTCIYLGHFKEESYFRKLQEQAREKPGITAENIAANLKVNVVLMKELLRVRLLAIVYNFLINRKQNLKVIYARMIQWKE